jgi:O-acetyl-ADP-ribose deacetylase (regulator of RNase III)
MIKLMTGDLLQSTCEAFVNPVNCVGVMGRGLALQFKGAFPKMFLAYQREAKAGRIKPGFMHIHEEEGISPRYIFNFPTKRHWRDPSKLDDIIDGLCDLERQVKRLGVARIAIPPLGCGLGGLDWQVVRPLIFDAFADLPEVAVALFEPTRKSENG